MDNQERVVAILEKLYNGQELNIKSLAKDFNVSTKTIQRDLKNKLNSHEILREGNKFSIGESAKDFDPKQKILIESFEGLAKKMGGDFLTHALEIIEIFKSHKPSLSFSLDKVDFEKSIKIIKAIKNKIKINFTYQTEQSKTKQQNITPIEVTLKGGLWTLIALEDDKIKPYRLNQIQNISHTKQRFNLPPQTNAIDISIFIYPQIAKYFRHFRFSQNQKNIQDKDGNLIIEFQANSLQEVVGEILKWIPDVVVLEPKELKDMIDEKIKTYAKRCDIN